MQAAAKPRLVLLVGLPQSGKTRVSLQLRAAGFDHIQRHESADMGSLVAAEQSSVKAARDVVVDSGNLTKDERIMWINSAKQAHPSLSIVTVAGKIDPSHLQYREMYMSKKATASMDEEQSRARVHEVIRMLDNTFEVPSTQEGIEVLTHIRDEDDLNQVLNWLGSAAQQAAVPVGPNGRKTLGWSTPPAPTAKAAADAWLQQQALVTASLFHLKAQNEAEARERKKQVAGGQDTPSPAPAAAVAQPVAAFPAPGAISQPQQAQQAAQYAPQPYQVTPAGPQAGAAAAYGQQPQQNQAYGTAGQGMQPATQQAPYQTSPTVSPLQPAGPAQAYPGAQQPQQAQPQSHPQAQAAQHAAMYGQQQQQQQQQQQHIQQQQTQQQAPQAHAQYPGAATQPAAAVQHGYSATYQPGGVAQGAAAGYGQQQQQPGQPHQQQQQQQPVQGQIQPVGGAQGAQSHLQVAAAQQQPQQSAHAAAAAAASAYPGQQHHYPGATPGAVYPSAAYGQQPHQQQQHQQHQMHTQQHQHQQTPQPYMPQAAMHAQQGMHAQHASPGGYNPYAGAAGGVQGMSGPHDHASGGYGGHHAAAASYGAPHNRGGMPVNDREGMSGPQHGMQGAGGGYGGPGGPGGRGFGGPGGYAGRGGPAGGGGGGYGGGHGHGGAPGRGGGYGGAGVGGPGGSPGGGLGAVGLGGKRGAPSGPGGGAGRGDLGPRDAKMARPSASSKPTAPVQPLIYNKEDPRPIVLFEMSGVLCNSARDRQASVAKNHLPRPGVRHLARLLPRFRLGIYTTAQDRTTATALTVVASAVRGELASWPDAWCMLTDGKPPVAKPETDEAAAAAAASGAADAAAAALGAEGTTAGESVEVTEVKAEGDAQEVEKDDVVVIGDDSATGTANENESGAQQAQSGDGDGKPEAAKATEKPTKAENGGEDEERPVAALFGSEAEASGVPIVPEVCAELERNGLSTKDIVGDVTWRSVFDPELVLCRENCETVPDSGTGYEMVRKALPKVFPDTQHRVLMVDESEASGTRDGHIGIKRWDRNNRADCRLEALVDAILASCADAHTDVAIDVREAIPAIKTAIAAQHDRPMAILTPTASMEGYFEEYPVRKNVETCQFFLQCGYCKFGDDCVHTHPADQRVKLNRAGFPLRPGRPNCQSFLRTAFCQAMKACNRNHPNLEYTPAPPHGSAGSVALTDGDMKTENAANGDHGVADGGGGGAHAYNRPGFSDKGPPGEVVEYNIVEEDWALELPQNPDAQECASYMKMGAKCPNHHPLNAGTKKNNYGFPMRANEVNCEFFLKHAICKFGMRCKKHHPHIQPGPPINKTQPFRVPKLTQVPADSRFVVVSDGPGQMPQYAANPNKQPCPHYVRTGHCRYGMKCLFDHPMVFGVSRNYDDLPMRPGSELCKHYLTHGTCSYGPACMLHHPNIAPKDPHAQHGPMHGGMRGGPGRGGMHTSPGRGGRGRGGGDMGGHPHMHAPWNGARGMDGGPVHGGMMHGRGAPAAGAPGYGYGGPGGMPGGPGAPGAGGMMMPQQGGMPQQQYGAPAQMYRM